MKKKSDALEIKVGLIYARDIISEVVAVVYDKMEFTHDGLFVSNYGDLYPLRKLFKASERDMSALNKAVLISVAKILVKEALDECPAFDFICDLKAVINRQAHRLPSISDAKSAIKFYCTNNSDIPFEKKEYTEKCFLLFAEKVCGL